MAPANRSALVICSPTHDHGRFYRSVLYNINLIIILMFIMCTCILRTHAISYKIGNLQTIAFVLNPNATVFYPKSRVQKLHTTISLNPNARKFTPFHKQKTTKRCHKKWTCYSSDSTLDETTSNIRLVNHPMHDIARVPGPIIDHNCHPMLLNANAECFHPGIKYQCNVHVSLISQGLNATGIKNDKLQVSYDSVLLVHNISTPDRSDRIDH